MSDTSGTGPSGLHPGLDPETLKTLSRARAGRSLLDTRVRPTELWEAVELWRTEGEPLGAELERLSRSDHPQAAGDAARSLFSKLQSIRRRDGEWVDNLRAVLTALPALADGETREFAIALVTISPQARDTASRWVADETESRVQAADVMGRVVRIAQLYQQALENGASSPEARKPAPPAAPAPRKDTRHLDPTAGITRILPRGVNLETLEDVGRVDHCRKILMGFDPELQLWECFCLVMKEDESWRESIDRLIRQETTGPPEEFTRGAVALFEELQAIRAEHAPFVRQLAGFVGDLPVGQYSTETRELALGFIVASPAGRERAAVWLSDPVHYRQEASTRYEGIIGRAMNYQSALRSF